MFANIDGTNARTQVVFSEPGPRIMFSRLSATFNVPSLFNSRPITLSNACTPNTGIAIVGPVSDGTPAASLYDGLSIDILALY